jgi:tetratricopeptide (TPR) repeat protein
MTKRNKSEGESVVEIDAIDNEEWEKDQHTPIAPNAELAELVKQTKAEPAKPAPAKPAGRPSTVSRSKTPLPPARPRAAKPTAKQAPVAADVAKSKAPAADEAPTVFSPIDPQILLEELPAPSKQAPALPAWARAPSKTAPPPDPSPLPAPLPAAPPAPDFEPVRASPILPALDESSVVASAKPRKRSPVVLIVLVLLALAGGAIAIVLAMGGKKDEPPPPPVAVTPPPPPAPDAAEEPAPAPEGGSATAPTLDPAKHPKGDVPGGKPLVLDYDQSAAKAPAPTHTDDDAVGKARAHWGAGNQRLFAGDPDSAIREYQQALAIYPGYVASYRGLGLAYAQKNDKAKALQALRTYVNLVPNAKDAPLIRKRIATLQGH